MSKTRQTAARAAALQRRRTQGRIASDGQWFIEPAWTVRALLREEPIFGRLYDPACGIGTVVKAARELGIDAYGSDLVDRAPAGATWFDGTADFLGGHADERHDNIVCNPPFGRGMTAKAFIERARLIARRTVAMIVPLPYLAGNIRSGRYALYTEPNRMPLACVYVLSDRPSMPPGGPFLRGEIKAEGGTEDYCWLVFRVGHRGDPSLRFLINQERSAA